MAKNRKSSSPRRRFGYSSQNHIDCCDEILEELFIKTDGDVLGCLPWQDLLDAYDAHGHNRFWACIYKLIKQGFIFPRMDDSDLIVFLSLKVKAVKYVNENHPDVAGNIWDNSGGFLIHRYVHEAASNRQNVFYVPGFEERLRSANTYWEALASALDPESKAYMPRLAREMRALYPLYFVEAA